MVDTCAAEFDAATPYFYTTYEDEDEAEPLPAPKAVVIGSGPIRIGQGIEFDYSCVQAAHALRAAGVRAIMINNNPETVSTDFDTSDRLYIAPLDEEGVLDILYHEGVGMPYPPGPLPETGRGSKMRESMLVGAATVGTHASATATMTASAIATNGTQSTRQAPLSRMAGEGLGEGRSHYPARHPPVRRADGDQSGRAAGGARRADSRLRAGGD